MGYEAYFVSLDMYLDWIFLHVEMQSITNTSDFQKYFSLIKKIPWPESASELYRPSDNRLSAKLVPTFTHRRYYVVSVTDSYGRILGFLDRTFH
jgi:hypothetical protein